MFDEWLAILKGIAALVLMWAIIFGVSNIIGKLRWVERRRLQRAFNAANNWPPKRPPHLKVGTYRIFYCDGTDAENRLIPAEIIEWAARCNRDAGDDPHFRILRILDANGVIVWPVSDEPRDGSKPNTQC